MSWARQSAAMLRALGVLKDLNTEAEKFTGEGSVIHAAEEAGEQINSSTAGEAGADNATPFGMGGLFGKVKTVAAAQKQVLKETQDARESLQKTKDDLMELFGDVAKHQRGILEEISQASTGYYEGMTLLRRAMETVEKIRKSQASGKGTFYLLEELDRIVYAINTYMGRAGRQVNTQTFFSLDNAKRNDGRSTGTNP